MKKSTLVLICVINLIGYSTILNAAAPEKTCNAYYEQWAAIPIQHCSTPKQKLECLKARILVKKLCSEEKQQEVKNKLNVNEKKTADEIEMPALQNPNDPITPREIAILKMLARK